MVAGTLSVLSGLMALAILAVFNVSHAPQRDESRCQKGGLRHACAECIYFLRWHTHTLTHTHLVSLAPCSGGMGPRPALIGLGVFFGELETQLGVIVEK